MKIEYFKLKGKVQLIGELVHVPRKNAPDLFKIVLTIETPDGQILYPELRNKKVKLIARENISVGKEVELEYSFQGSEKNGKRYNNLYVNSITPLCK